MAGRKLEPFKAGDDKRTARHASVMNEIITRLNALLEIQLAPASAGKVLYSDSNVLIDLTTLKGIPEPPATGTYVLGSIDAVVQWLSTEECDCLVDGGEI